MSMGRFFCLVMALYFAFNFLGAALFTGGGYICLFGSWLWFGVALCIAPVFRKKAVENTEENVDE